MHKSLVPALQRQWQMLEEDTHNHRASLKKLNAYAKDLDPQMIPFFVSEVSEAVCSSVSCEDDAILVFETLARLHGKKIIPNIGKIMSAVLTTMSSSVESFESCSKVVSAIALYGIDPLALDKENMKIIQSLCEPLSDALMCFEGNTSSGAAFCLMGLVNMDVWRFASNEIVNEVCLKIAASLGEASTQLNSHIGLVMDLAKHNVWVLEPYVSSIIKSGVNILSDRLEDNNSQRCFSVIQMISFLMRCVDARSFFSEIESIIECMEKFRNDQSPYVQDAALDALETAKIIGAAPGGLRNKLESNPIRRSNLCRECEAKASWFGSDNGVIDRGSPFEHPSHESQPLFYDSFLCSAMLSGHSSSNIHGVRHADKHCRNSELKEASKEFRTSIQSSNFNSSNLLAESACTNSKRSCFIDDVKMTSNSRRLMPCLHNYSTSTVRNLEIPDFRLLRRLPSKDEAYMLQNEIDCRNMLYRRANSDNLKMCNERKTQDGLRRGLELPSCDSSALLSNSMQTCIRAGLKEGKNEQIPNLKKFNLSKVPFGKICGFFMVFFAIILLVRLINNDEALLNVFPT